MVNDLARRARFAFTAALRPSTTGEHAVTRSPAPTPARSRSFSATWRASYGLRASSAILFNHESELRDEAFVTRKLSRAVARIALGRAADVALGNLDARRDFGYAPDYVAAMVAMAARAEPGDYVLATGAAHSVRAFIEAAFQCVGVSLAWRGEGMDEEAYDLSSGRLLVAVDPQFYRPNEVHELIGDAAKARRELGWAPRTEFRALVREMVLADLAAYPGVLRDRALAA